MKVVVGLFAAAAVLADSVPVFAQAGGAIDTATLAAARRLIRASDLDAQIRALLPQITEAAMAQARNSFKAGAMPEALKSKLEAAMREHMGSLTDVFTPDVQDRMADAYARHFSRADLDHLADMMSDPAMIRFRRGTPAVMAEVMPIILGAVQPAQQAFQKRVVAIIREWIETHPDDRDRLQPARS